MRWLRAERRVPRRPAASRRATPAGGSARRCSPELAAELPFAYVPRFYEPEYYADGRLAALNRTRADVPETIEPSVIDDLEAMPLPTRADRAVCRMRSRSDRDRDHARLPLAMPLLPEHGDQAAAANPRGRDDRRRGARERIATRASTKSRSCRFRPATIRISSSWSRRMHETFRPLGVNIAVPSLRVNEHSQERGGADRHAIAIRA